MIYGYCRVSKDSQTVDNQSIAIKARFPDAAIHSETISGASEEKQALNALIASLQGGDTLVVVAMDRLSRTMLQGAKLIKDLTERGVVLVSLREGLDLSTPMGRAMAQLLFLFAEIELSNIRERTKAGLKRAKAQGKQIGRRKGAPIKNKLSLGRPKQDHTQTITKLKQLRESGMTIRQIAMSRDLSPAWVSELLKQAV